MFQSLFAKIRHYKDKVTSWDSAKFFTFTTLNPSGRTKLISKWMSGQKHRNDLFSFGFKKKQPKKVASK